MADRRLTSLVAAAIVLSLAGAPLASCRNGNDGPPVIGKAGIGGDPGAETAGAALASAVGLVGVVAIVTPVAIMGSGSATHTEAFVR
jgi:hypothetical protein